MIDIFEKYDFSVDTFMNDQSSNLIIFQVGQTIFLISSQLTKEKNFLLTHCYL